MRARFALVLLAALAACSYGPTDYGTTPTYSLTVGAETLSLKQGAVTTTSVRIARSAGSTGEITVHGEGAPAGLVVEVIPSPVTDSLTLRVTAAATITPGNYSLHVVANGYGGTREAEVTVTVTPAETMTPPAFKAIFAGEHSCAINTVGDATCWGPNAAGQLGDGTVSANSSVPVVVSGGLSFATLSVSKVTGATCGLASTGLAYCWGTNLSGQLGDGTTAERHAPTAVAGGIPFKSVALGASHACAIALNGSAWCWGSSQSGALGNGQNGRVLVPTAIQPQLVFQSVVAGEDFSCALTEIGMAFCWGLGTQGQLGNGAIASAPAAVGVAGGHFFRSITAGGRGACGLTFDGKAYCWGNNFFGTLGTGSLGAEGGTSRAIEPVPVAGNLTFRSISAGYFTTCGVTFDNEGYCWGYNFGAVGDGTNDHRPTPTRVSGGLGFLEISGGTGQSCGLTTTRLLYCWGDNPNGEVGDGSTQPRLAPVPVRVP